MSRLMLDNFDHIKAYWVMLSRRSRKSRYVLVPAIWTAPSRKKRFITMPARGRQSSRRAAELERLFAPRDVFPSNETPPTIASTAPRCPPSSRTSAPTWCRSPLTFSSALRTNFPEFNISLQQPQILMIESANENYPSANDFEYFYDLRLVRAFEISQRSVVEGDSGQLGHCVFRILLSGSGNRIGSDEFSAGQLKIIQGGDHPHSFCRVFSHSYLGEKLKWNYGAGFACIVPGDFLFFTSGSSVEMKSVTPDMIP